MPEHARFSWRRLLQVGLAGGLLWLVPMGILMAVLGWTHTLTQMGWL